MVCGYKFNPFSGSFPFDCFIFYASFFFRLLCCQFRPKDASNKLFLWFGRFTVYARLYTILSIYNGNIAIVVEHCHRRWSNFQSQFVTTFDCDKRQLYKIQSNSLNNLSRRSNFVIDHIPFQPPKKKVKLIQWRICVCIVDSFSRRIAFWSHGNWFESWKLHQNTPCDWGIRLISKSKLKCRVIHSLKWLKMRLVNRMPGTLISNWGIMLFVCI